MDMDKDFILVFANGIVEDARWVEPYLAKATAVIAADGGVRHLLALGHLPDVLIGDLDSLPEGVEEVMGAWETVIIRYPPDKNETDLELAMLYAAEKYPRHNILVAGGFGGRLDHTLANILLLAHPALLTRAVFFLDGVESVRLLVGEGTINGQPGDIVSLLPLGGAAHIEETSGLRWPLHDEILSLGPARGVSNEMTAAQATVRLRNGLLWCFHISDQATIDPA